MILGMSMETFTFVHVALSLIGIIAGFIVMFGLLSASKPPEWTALFLTATVATSVTGFGFPFTKLLPSHIIGIISLVVLSIAIFALYARRLAGIWHPVYAASAMMSLYLNVFVLIVQGFTKIVTLQALAPTQSEPPFLIAQAATLLLFVVVTFVVVRKTRNVPLRAA